MYGLEYSLLLTLSLVDIECYCGIIWLIIISGYSSSKTIKLLV